MPKCIELLPCDWLISNVCYQAIEQVYLIKWSVSVCVYIYVYIYIYNISVPLTSEMMATPLIYTVKLLITFPPVYVHLRQNLLLLTENSSRQAFCVCVCQLKRIPEAQRSLYLLVLCSASDCDLRASWWLAALNHNWLCMKSHTLLSRYLF